MALTDDQLVKDEWFVCPVCDGDEGYVAGDDWINCDCCDGQGGFANITPAQRSAILEDC